MRQSDSNFQMEALNALFDLSNSEWLIIAPLLPGAEGKKNGRFNRWAKKGIWLCMFETLAANSPQSLQLIDSSIIRAHQHAAGDKKGSGQRHRPFSWRTEH